LLAYTKGRPEFGVLNELASQKKPPLYLVLPPQQNKGAGTDGSEESSAEGSTGSSHEAPEVLSIFKGKWDSSIPDATAIFIQNKTGDARLMSALSRIVNDQPPELFDGDLVILDSADLDDLRRIVRINKDSPFVTTRWEQAFLLTSIHSTQLTLITGMKRGSHGMTIIHCFPNTAGPMPAIEVGPDKQDAVRGLIEVLRSGLIPVNVRVNLDGVPDQLGVEELETIYPALSLNLERGDKTTRLEQILARQLDKKTRQVTLLAQVPRDILRGGSLSISLPSDRFMFVDTESRRRVSEITIDGWLSNDSQDVRPTSVKVARKFDEKGTHDDLRSYVIPQEIVEDLDGPNCREAATATERTGVRCSALGYLVAVVGEIKIVRDLTAGKMKVSVVLDEPSSRWVSPARQRTRDAAIAICNYLRKEVKMPDGKELTVEEMIRVGPQSPSEGGIEIRLIE